MTTMTVDHTPWYSQRWPWLLMLGPALVFVAGAYTTFLAFSQQDALVVGDYYKKGKAINQDLRRDRAAGQLGLSLDMHYDAANGVLLGKLDSDGPLDNKVLLLHLAHATQPARDLRLIAQPDASGNFSVHLPMLERSRWQVLVENGERSWRLEGSWQWPAQHDVALRPLSQ